MTEPSGTEPRAHWTTPRFARIERGQRRLWDPATARAQELRQRWHGRRPFEFGKDGVKVSKATVHPARRSLQSLEALARRSLPEGGLHDPFSVEPRPQPVKGRRVSYAPLTTRSRRRKAVVWHRRFFSPRGHTAQFEPPRGCRIPPKAPWPSRAEDGSVATGADASAARTHPETPRSRLGSQRRRRSGACSHRNRTPASRSWCKPRAYACTSRRGRRRRTGRRTRKIDLQRTHPAPLACRKVHPLGSRWPAPSPRQSPRAHTDRAAPRRPKLVPPRTRYRTSCCRSRTPGRIAGGTPRVLSRTCPFDRQRHSAPRAGKNSIYLLDSPRP